MTASDRFHQYAADSVERARAAEDAGDRNIHLNMALAWVRLAHQSAEAGQAPGESAQPSDDPGPSAT
jgi:hypothetical protein